MSDTPTLIQEAKEGKARLFLQMGGQGALWQTELARYYGESAFEPFFDASISALEEEWDSIKDLPYFPLGLDVRSWFKPGGTLPPDEYLESSAISMPMIQMTQLAHYENLVLNGWSRSDLIRYSTGITGHSQGLISAALLSLGLEGKEYYDRLRLFMKYALYLGIRSQEAYPHPHATEEEIRISGELDDDPPSPMVAVVGETHEMIESLVDEINRELPPETPIHISLYNTPRNRILSSHRSSLIEFNRKYANYIEEKRFKYIYLKTSCPFHSPYMRPIREDFEKDIARIGLSIPGGDLKLPVYSFFDGRNLQNDGDVAFTMYPDMVINTLYWEKAVIPSLREGDVTHIIDFGPGKTTQRFTNECLSEREFNPVVLAAAIAKDQKKLLA